MAFEWGEVWMNWKSISASSWGFVLMCFAGFLFNAGVILSVRFDNVSCS